MTVKFTPCPLPSFPPHPFPCTLSDWWTTETQPGNPYGDNPTEPNWQLQALVVGLSTGPNGPSDGIGYTNASLILSTVRADGLNLQPDRPATTMDAALLQVFSTGAVPDVRSTWTAYGDYRWTHLLAAQLERAFPLTLSDLGPLGTSAPAYAVFDAFAVGEGASPLHVLPATAPLTPFDVPYGQGQPSAPAKAHSIQHLLVVPQLPGGWWLYGEAGKVVPMSKQRVAALSLLADGFTARVLTGEGESVSFLVAPSSGVLHAVPCAASATTLSCTAGACKCA